MEDEKRAVWVIWMTKGASLAAFVIQLLEFGNHLFEEIEYLWRARITFITFLYAWSRYFPLCAQAVNLALSEIIHTSPSAKLCMVTFVLKAVTAQVTTTGIEMILAVRVHALYNCSRRSGLFLIGVLFVGAVLEITATTKSMTHLKPAEGRSICFPSPTPIATLTLFAIGCGLTQSVLLFMTLFKVIPGRKLGWNRTPVVSLMLRDGVMVFLMLAVAISTILGFERLRDQGVQLWNAAFSWYVALLSISGCRLIMNMRKLAVTHPRNRRQHPSIELTSIIELDDYCSTRS